MENNKDLENNTVVESNVNTSMVDNKKSKSNILIVIIVILCMVIGGLSGFVIYSYLDSQYKDDNLENKNENNSDDNSANNSVDNSDVVVLDVLSDVVQYNFNKFMNISGVCSGGAVNYFTTSKVEASNIDNKIAYFTVEYDFHNNKNAIDPSEVTAKVKEYFGDDYNFQHQGYSACVSHDYNSETGKYEYVEPACGCTSGPNSSKIYKVSKAYIENDLLILNVKVLFPGPYNDSLNERGYHKYYSDAARTKEIAGLVYSEVEDGWILGARPLDTDDNFAKGGNYKFVLKKVTDGIYSFVSSEPVA